ncbi:alpha/beta fold hydrolase [Zavarzinia sp. CC-PAN008]|uniref:alpha/beta fold hydrolase n=1 Tax=Zavarzinia sp. CC-PAN008 TaxID=3243332 RepID=UPI003F742E91
MMSFPAPRPVAVNGITLAVHEAGPAGAATTVVLCHGFPELAFSWRHQVAALAAAGYRVVAPDMRGFGGSSRPEPVEAYAMSEITADMAGLLDALGVEEAVFLGHDWGGAVVWAMGLAYPERTAGIIALNTPFMPRMEVDFLSVLVQARGAATYMNAFQEPGLAEAVLGKDVEATFRATMRRRGLTLDEFFTQPPEVQAIPIGIFIGDPPVLGAPLLSEDELAVFVETYRRTGFTGGLNWYRNIRRSWEQAAGAPTNVVAPALMISAADDFFLPPVMTEGMEQHVPDLEKHIIADCGHWTQQEQPEETNRLILDWLGRRFPA